MTNIKKPGVARHHCNPHHTPPVELNAGPRQINRIASKYCYIPFGFFSLDVLTIGDVILVESHNQTGQILILCNRKLSCRHNTQSASDGSLCVRKPVLSDSPPCLLFVRQNKKLRVKFTVPRKLGARKIKSAVNTKASSGGANNL